MKMKKTIFCLTLVLMISSACFGKNKKMECKRKAMCAKLKEQETTLADLIKKVENLEKEPATPAPTTPAPAQRAHYDIFFPAEGGYATTDRAVPSLNAFTLCTWINAPNELANGEETVRNSILFFLGATDEDYAIGLAYLQYEEKVFLRMIIKLDQMIGQFDPANIGKWQHTCMTWDNTDGLLKGYQNGKLIQQLENIETGTVLSRYGVLLGQGPEGALPYYGHLNGLNMWDHVLSDEEISRMSTECSSSEGNVLKWSDFKSGIHGDATIVDPSTCSI